MKSEQLERGNYIGGTDVAAILGFSKYKTPFQVWEEKTGRGNPIPDNPAMAWGRRLEDVIAQEYAEKFNAVLANPKLEVHKQFPMLGGRPDRFVTVDGMPVRVLEIKTKGGLVNWGDEIPISYHLQVLHYQFVTGIKAGELYWLDMGTRETNSKQLGDKLEMEYYEAKIVPQLVEFWEHYVMKDTPPPPVTVDDVQSLDVCAGKAVEVSSDYLDAVNELQSVKQQMKALKAEEDELKTKIILGFGDAEVMNCNGSKIATYKRSKDSISFDSKQLEKENPVIFQQYCFSRKGSRTLRLSK